MDTTALPPPLPEPRKQRGCLFYGCIIAAVVAVVGGLGGYFLVRYALERLVTVAEEYTEATPMQLPPPPAMSASDYERVVERVETFAETLDAVPRPEPLVLTSDEINVLIARHPSFEFLRGNLHVALEDDRIHAQIALPLRPIVEHMPILSQLEDRYLNGDATLRIVLVDDITVVSLRSLTVKGEELPPDIMAELRSQNLFARHVDDPQFREFRRKIERIEIEDGKLLVVPKQPK